MENVFKKSGSNTRVVLTTAAILAVQALPIDMYAQVVEKTKTAVSTERAMKVYPKVEIHKTMMTVVGVSNGAPVFKNDNGEFFTVNENTGDLSFIKPEEFAQYSFPIKMKGNVAAATSKQGSSIHIKLGNENVSKVTIQGKDAQGHTLMKNSRGENFYIDPITGDLIFIKI